MADRPAAPRNEPFPPVSFPVCGLASPFGGVRWLELFGDPPDGEPHWVSLWHQSADDQSAIQVTTYTRRAPGNPNGWRVPTDEQAAKYGASPLESLAGQCATTLIDMTLPVLSLTRPPGFLGALVDLAQTAADAYAEWDTVDWRVDGIAVAAPTWSFAGGWAGFTDAAAGVYVSVVGIGPGPGPEGLAFAALRDSEAYHFDLHGPLSLETAAASRDAAGVPLERQPPWLPKEWHPDQLRLMRQLGSDPVQ
jgi:hypothetical protein